MRSTPLVWVLAAAAVAAVAACSSKPSNDDAILGMSAVVGDSADIQDSAVDQAQSGSALPPYQLDYMTACGSGGMASITGNWDGTGAAYDNKIAFSACNANGATLTGNVEWIGTVKTSGQTSFIDWTLDGSVDLVTANGSYSCDVAMTGNTSNAGDESIDGQFCGVTVEIEAD